MTDEAGTADVSGLLHTAATVDRLQGREAAVAIISMAASSADDAPRGVDFLLSINCANAAISRGQWHAHVGHSSGLREHLPVTPEGVAQLSAFLPLVRQVGAGAGADVDHTPLDCERLQ